MAKIRAGDDEPTPEQQRLAVRDVITHCIYGVDKNPLAVDLCKVALWMEGHAGGKPLTFLDHRILCGDSLVGVLDLGVLEKGIPDEAYDQVSGDDKGLARSLKRQNKEERKGAGYLPFPGAKELHDLSEEASVLAELPDDSPENVRRKSQAYQKLHSKQSKWWDDSTACHLWTAAFFAELTPENQKKFRIPSTADLRRHLARQAVDSQVVGSAWALAERHSFFHWPLEFPDVFEAGGFDVILCNPPWERIKLQEQEFFATRDSDIAKAPNKAARGRLIKGLKESKPDLWREYRVALHAAEASSKYLRHSERYPFTARGDINTYSVFSELFTRLINPKGRAGVVVPTGIATDDTNKVFFSHLIENGRLASLYDFENRDALFPGVHRSYKFSLLTVRGGEDEKAEPPQFAFFLHHARHLQDERRVFSLSAEDFERINPNTKTCPVFRTRADADLTRSIYERVPVLVNEETKENPWGVSFLRMFDMSNDSHLFRTRAELEGQGFHLVGNRFVKGEDVWLPLYEAKFIDQFEHRHASCESEDAIRGNKADLLSAQDREDAARLVIPRYWTQCTEVGQRLADAGWKRRWLISFRNVTRAVDLRTCWFSVLPNVAVGNSTPVLLPMKCDSILASCLLANMDALAFDYVTRQKIPGINMNFFFVNQLPALAPDRYAPENVLFVIPRVLELVYTAWDIKPFADDVWRDADADLRAAIQKQWDENKTATGGHEFDPPEWAEIAKDGIPLPPFKWNGDRRAHIRAELDATYARLYGLTRKQLRYILDPADLTPKELADILDPFEEVTAPLDPAGYAKRCDESDFPSETFRVLKEKEIRHFGEYRTRRLVLEAWERMASGGERGGSGAER